MTTATARSTTLPRRMKSLNPLIMSAECNGEPLGHRRRRHPGRQLARHRDQDQPAVAPSRRRPRPGARPAPRRPGRGRPAPRSRSSTPDHVDPAARGRAGRRRPDRRAAPAPPRSPGPAPQRGPTASRASVIGSPARAAPTSTRPSAGDRLAQRPGRDELARPRPNDQIGGAQRRRPRSDRRPRPGPALATARPGGATASTRASVASRPAANRRNRTSRRQPGPGHSGRDAVPHPGSEASRSHRSKVGRLRHGRRRASGELWTTPPSCGQLGADRWFRTRQPPVYSSTPMCWTRSSRTRRLRSSSSPPNPWCPHRTRSSRHRWPPRRSSPRRSSPSPPPEPERLSVR